MLQSRKCLPLTRFFYYFLCCIDYENFATDMTVERQFIEDNAALCEDGDIKKCLFVYMRGGHSGIMVVPDSNDHDYVGCAALIREN